MPASAANEPRVIASKNSDPSAERLADARWCTETPDAQALELEAQANASSAPIGIDYLEKLSALPAGQRFERATQATRAAWASALMVRGDEQSLAVADFLLSRSGGQLASAAMARLTERARSSKDGFVIALALQRCQFEAGGCPTLNVGRWAQVEPGNMQAWVREAARAGKARNEQALAEAVYRVGQATSSDSYRTDMQRLLLSLPQSDQAGLQMAVEMTELGSIVFGWSGANASALSTWCNSELQDANRQQSCALAAEQLWARADNMLDAIFAVKIAKQKRPPDPAWQAREQTLMAARQFDNIELNASIETAASVACGGIEPMKQSLVQRLRGNEWQGLKGRLRTSGKSEAALAADWRAEHPPTAQTPAPAVTKP